MALYRLMLIGGLMLISSVSDCFAQSDKWVGEWGITYQPWPHIPPVEMKLHISSPVKGALYPAKLTLEYSSFFGEYEVLLAKKNDGQLGIGRNKYPIHEEPYGLGAWMMYLNGTLDFQDTDVPTLHLNRMWISNFGIFMQGLYDDELFTNQKVHIRDFLYRDSITLRKISDVPWEHPNTERIVNTDSIYYGVYEPVELTHPNIRMAIQDEERYDRDTITIVHNGNVLVDRIEVGDLTDLSAEIRLDTGENFITFFADNYGDLPPNTASFLMMTERDGQHVFDFTNKANAYATFMVARVRYHGNDIDTLPKKIPKTSSLGRENIPIGEMHVRTEKISLELWDRQIADGDIVSLQVNGAWVLRNEEVKKEKKRIGVTMKPGRNRFIFRAENLGRIPPNTAVLRVLHAEGERIFYLHTDLKRNNVLDIYYLIDE